jgi:putative transposase
LSSKIEDGLKTCIYQIQGVWSRRMPFLLNVVIIVKTDIEAKKSGRVVLFSTDLTLTGMKIIRFYSLRFQIEFNFRDAKQYFGLSDFKNIKETQVNNAVGLSLFMDNVSLILIEKAKEVWKEDFISIQDLKAHFRAEKYIADILNTLEIPESIILNHEAFDDIRKIGAINRRK